MSSVTFCGRPLSPFVSAEVEWPAAHALAAETARVPGRPGLEWHDVVCADSTGWPTPLADASATVTFLCLDPIAYGAERSSAGDAFEVGGTWPTKPVVELTATAGSGASVACVATGERVELARTLAAGDLVRVDCAAQTVAVNGVDATADVTLESDFFGLAPGRAALSFSGCSSHLVLWRERWA